MRKIFLILLLLLPTVSSAATLRMDPAPRTVSPGDVFVTNVRLEVDQNECVNATNVVVNYPANELRLNALSSGESIFTLWIDQKIDHENGVASFVAGIPAGYCGKTQGDPGQSNIIAKLAFQYVGAETSGSPIDIAFSPDTEVIQNDGVGSKAPLSLNGLRIAKGARSGDANEWLLLVNADHFPPEAFTPQIIQDTEGSKANYLIFDTIDKQTGVEHYEVSEEDPMSFGFRLGSRVKARLSRATSPYLLVDQTLRSRIVVRAYDHAGNMQESIIPPKNSSNLFGVTGLDYPAIISWTVLLGVIIFGSYLLYRFIVRLRKSENEYVEHSENPNDENTA